MSMPWCQMCRLEFKIQDMWVGAFWKTTRSQIDAEIVIVDLWICIIPCFPIHLQWSKILVDPVLAQAMQQWVHQLMRGEENDEQEAG